MFSTLSHSTPTPLICRTVQFSRRPCAVRAAVDKKQNVAALVELPRNVAQMVKQAAETVQRAQVAGHKRQIVEFLNPVNEKAMNFMAIDAMDYPCSNMKEFESIVNVTKALLQELAGEDATIKTKRIDEGGIDGDLCAIVYTADKSVVTVVWPTAEKLKELKKLSEDSAIKLLLIVNPLWKTTGNLVSEFGFGPWRKANEEFVATFLPSYALFEQRIGAPSSINMATGNRYDNGAVLRTLLAYPEKYTAHIMSGDGASQAMAAFSSRPTYQELEETISKARQAKMEIFKVAAAASNVFVEPVEGEESERAFYSPEEVMDMEPVKLRRALIQLGLPSAGSLQRLQSRLLAVAEAVQGGDSVAEGVDKARKLK